MKGLSVQFVVHRLRQRPDPFVHVVVLPDHHLFRDEEQIFLRHGGGGICYAFHREADISICLHDVLVRIAAQVLDNRSGGIHRRNVHLICPAAGDPHSLAHKDGLVHRPGTHLRVHLPQACVKASHLIFQMKGLSIQFIVHRIIYSAGRSGRYIGCRSGLIRCLCCCFRVT